MPPSAFQYSNCHPNCCHSLQQVRLTECSIILTTLLRILFVNNDTRTFHSDGTDMFIDKYLHLRDELKILSKLQAFARNTLCGAVSTNCFEKCTYFFANITVRMIQEMHQSDWEKLFSGLKQWIQRDVKEEVKDTTEEEEEEEEREYREEEEKDEEERMRQHGRGRSRARRQTVSYILVDACQGWIRHARGFYPRCLARDNIACDVEDVLWPDPDQRQDAGAESLFLLLFAVLYCTLQYIKLRNKTHGEYHKQHLLPVLNWIVLNLSHPCVRLCCGVCVFEGLCVMSESKVWFFSKIELFWVESFILTWI